MNTVDVGEVRLHVEDRGIPGAELVVLPGGHCPQEDHPASWLAAVQAHLSRVT